jgi:hypothetical protein
MEAVKFLAMKTVLRIIIGVLAFVGVITLLQWVLIKNDIGKTKQGVVQKIK